MKLGTIKEEAAACRAAWASHPKAKYGTHIHHEIVAENLTEPIENRIAYILSGKPKHEQALRLRLMRPVAAAALAEYDKAKAAAWADYNKVEAAALAEYDKVRAAALAEYDKVAAAAWAEYDKVAAPALAEYDKVRAAALAEYDKVRAAALAEYDKVAAAALAEYDKVAAAAHQAICPTPDCPFADGSIFGGAK